MSMKKNSILYLYHIKVKKEILVLNLLFMKKRTKTLLPTNIRTKIAVTGSKLSACFQVKDKTMFERDRDLFTMVPVLKLIVLKIILERLHGEYREEFEVIQINMWTHIFLNMQLKVDMKC